MLEIFRTREDFPTPDERLPWVNLCNEKIEILTLPIRAMRNLHIVSAAEAAIISYGLTLDMTPESLQLERVNRRRSGVPSAIAYSGEARRCDSKFVRWWLIGFIQNLCDGRFAEMPLTWRGKEMNIVATTRCDSVYTPGFRLSSTVTPDVFRAWATGGSAGSASAAWSWTRLLFQERIRKGRTHGNVVVWR
jgi:hypothetical protein